MKNRDLVVNAHRLAETVFRDVLMSAQRRPRPRGVGLLGDAVFLVLVLSTVQRDHQRRRVLHVSLCGGLGQDRTEAGVRHGPLR